MPLETGSKETLPEAEALLRRGEPLAAAAKFETAELWERAIDSYELAGDLKTACQLALRCGAGERALRLAAEGNLTELISVAEAALLLEAGWSPNTVARLLSSLGWLGRAADLLAVAGEHREASRLFLQSGWFLEAAFQLAAAGDVGEAGLLLKRHLIEAPDDMEARALLGHLLLRAGREREAVAEAQTILRGAPHNRDALELASWGFERMGLPKAARHMALRIRALPERKNLLAPRSETGEHRSDPGSESWGSPRRFHLEPLDLPFGAESAGLGELGHFKLVERLGEGASSVVYRALDWWSGRWVALKRLRPGLEERPEALHRFLLEARLVSRLRHPNIVQIYETGLRGRYIAAELMTGGTLEKRIQRSPIPLAVIRRWILQALAGIERVHFEGIVHRDLKPGNLLFDAGGRLKIGDFGVAHVLDSSWTKTGTVIGTYGYLAPEQLRGERVTTQADLYALGVVLYEMLCRRPPFSGRDLVRDQLGGVPRLPLCQGRRLSCSLEEAIFSLMALDPLDRPASAKEAAQLLSEASWELGEPGDETALPGHPPGQMAWEPPVGEIGTAEPVSGGRFPEPRFELLAQGTDQLGGYRRLRDHWLGRILMERTYVPSGGRRKRLDLLLATSPSLLPLIVEVDFETGRVCWVSGDDLPGDTRPTVVQELLEEIGRQMGLRGTGWWRGAELESLASAVRRLPDGTVLFGCLDPFLDTQWIWPEAGKMTE